MKTTVRAMPVPKAERKTSRRWKRVLNKALRQSGGADVTYSARRRKPPRAQPGGTQSRARPGGFRPM